MEVKFENSLSNFHRCRGRHDTDGHHACGKVQMMKNKKKKLKGILSIEAVIVVPVFCIFILSAIVVMKASAMQSYFHTSCISAMAMVNRAALVINTYDIESADGGDYSNEYYQKFITLLGDGTSSDMTVPFGEEDSEEFKALGKLTEKGVAALLFDVFYTEFNNTAMEYWREEPGLLRIMMRDFKFVIYPVVKENGVRKVKYGMEYTLHIPFDFVEEKRITETFVAYIE